MRRRIFFYFKNNIHEKKMYRRLVKKCLCFVFSFISTATCYQYVKYFRIFFLLALNLSHFPIWMYKDIDNITLSWEQQTLNKIFYPRKNMKSAKGLWWVEAKKPASSRGRWICVLLYRINREKFSLRACDQDNNNGIVIHATSTSTPLLCYLQCFCFVLALLACSINYQELPVLPLKLDE
jgi:hypothetical protein